MARYGIGTGTALGVTVTELRGVARGIGRDHELAGGLWDSGIHEARILASLVDDPALVDDAQFERWGAGFDSWDLCDQVCQNLFRYAPAAWTKATEWTTRPEPFVKRAGFTLMAGLAVAEKRADDERFAALLGPLAAGADDDRPLVRKGASWALRAIGKRSRDLNRRAIETAEELRARGGGARWVGTDAMRELSSPAVQARLGSRGGAAPSQLTRWGPGSPSTPSQDP
ncbi:DNA alkylation repair protein [Blastococcus sp. CT_GayMR20]|nr:DNA alkylation repair protein [Blastococcus sp. CT_GayMR20]TFV80190.1 DNA alkylation repair protein [Blastococcus sp. CT_GayMR20]